MADRPLGSNSINSDSINSEPIDTQGDLSTEDALFKAALHEVPLPAGLALRLKAHIRAQYPDQDQAAPSAASADVISINSVRQVRQADSSDEPDSSDKADTEHEAGWLRRTILVAAVAAGICGFAYLARQWTRPAEPSWLAAKCDAILVQIDQDNPANWQAVGQPLPAGLARVQAQLARLAIVAERPLKALGSKTDGIVYRLDAGDGRGIFLMRLESLPAVRGLTSRFEILPTPSGGWTLAAMTVGKETYVLAAACTEQQLFSYIRRPALT